MQPTHHHLPSAPSATSGRPPHTGGWLRRLWQGPTARVLRRYPGLLVVPAVFFVAAAFDSAITSGPVICVFRLGSGLPCAGCGMTRGFVAIAHGHPEVAPHYNLFSPVAFAWMALWWLGAVVQLGRGRAPWAHPPWLAKTAIVVLLSYWLIRASWFAMQPGAWADMVETSPVMHLVDWLTRAPPGKPGL